MSQKGQTTAAKFVYVKSLEKKSLAAKKALMPVSLSGFKKAAQKLFSFPTPILALYTEDLKLITSMKEMNQGATIFVSTKDSEEKDFEQVDTTPIGNIDDIPVLDPHEPLRFTPEPQAQPNLIAVGLSDRTPQRRPTPPQRHSYQKRVVDLIDDDPDQLSDSVTQQTSGDLPSAEALNEGEQDNLQQAPQIVEEEEDQLEKTLSHLFGDIGSALFPIFEKTKDSEILITAEKYETQHCHYWTSSLTQYFDSIITPPQHETGVVAEEEMIIRADQIINQHRFVQGGEYRYKFNTAIVGPPLSGKTTFLNHLAKRVLIDAASTNAWRSYFIFSYDAQQIAHQSSQLEELFKSFVALFLQSLQIQAPLYRQIITDIRQCLLSVVTDQIQPSFRKTVMQNSDYRDFAMATINFCQTMKALYEDKRFIESWFTSLFLMPQILSRAAGFKQILYIVDNFDSFSIDPDVQTSSVIFISEHAKFALLQGQFILSTQNASTFLTLSTPIGDNGADLTAVLDYVELNGIVQTVKWEDQIIFADIDGIPQPLQLKASCCGGIPAFVCLWNRMVDSIEAMEQMEESAEKEEEKYTATANCQALISRVFVAENEEDELLVREIRHSQPKPK